MIAAPLDESSSPTIEVHWAQRLAGVGRLVLIGGAAGTSLIFDTSVVDSFAQPKTVVLAGSIAVAATIGIGEFLLRIGSPWGAANRRRRLIGGLTIGLALLYCIATMRSIDRTHSMWGEPFQFQGLIPFLLTLAAGLLALTWTRDERDLRRAMIAVASIGMPMSIYAFAQMAYRDPWWDELPNERAFATLGQANALGAALVVAVLCSIGAATATEGWRRLAWWAVAGVHLLAMTMTLSRGAYIGLAAGLVVWWLLRPRHTLPRARVALPVLVGVLLIPRVRGALRAAITRAGSLAQGRDDPSIGPHLGLLRAARAIVADQPWTGIGPDNYVLIFDRYRNTVMPPEESWVLAQFRPESPHNVVAARAVDAGLPAAAVYLAIFIVAAALIVQATRRTSGARRAILGAGMAIITAHFVTDLFMTGETAGTLIGWIMLGSTVAVATMPSSPAHPNPTPNLNPTPI